MTRILGLRQPSRPLRVPVRCPSRAPVVTYKEQVGDIARAIRWVHDDASDHGGDPSRVFLMRYSAGAHLDALFGADN
jgi:acetyl esterase/lipase